MAKPEIVVLQWDHAVPHITTKSLRLPFEGLVENGQVTRDDISPQQVEWIHRDIAEWESNLPAELDRIAEAAADALTRNPGKFERAEAERVLWLVNELRAIKAKQRQRDVMLGYLIGRRVERMGVLPMEPLVVSGRKAKIDRPRAMQRAKAAADKIKRRENRQRAEQALEWARRNYSMTNDNIDYLKGKAAEHEGVTKRTLRRWLTGK